MMNSALTFMSGLVVLAVALMFAENGISNLAVVSFFILALYLLIPATILQMPDDHFLYRALRRLRRRS